ncbi:MAG: translocation/assembly module TamB domain-containing protein [Candidatus Poribacteria bacterium]|nr:translocation/assembly module TamB domain-containing protein [Candidatus Poribacteria bacterium]
MKRRNRLLILLTVIAVALVVGGFFFLRSSYLLNKIRLVLETQLEKTLQHPVTIGQISGHPLTGLNIKQFEISDSLPDNPALISVDEIQVKYKLWSLLRGKFLVTQLNFKRPQINAHIDLDGHLNLAKLIPKEKMDSNLPLQPLIADISIEDGDINFDDEKRNCKIAIKGIYSRSRADGASKEWRHTGSLEVQDGRFELNGVETQIDEFKTEFELQANSGTLRALRLAFGNSFLHITGSASSFSRPDPVVETRLHLSLDFQDLKNILPSLCDMEGVVQVDVEASGSISALAGRVELKLPFARFNELQLENLVAEAQFTPNRFYITEIDGTLASGKFTGGAEVNITSESPNWQFTAQPNLTYSGWLQLASLEAEQLIPMLIGLPEGFLVVKGELDGRMQFSGSSANPTALQLDGTLQLNHATLNDVPIRGSVAHYGLSDDRLSITANLDETQIELSGELGLARQTDMDLRITQIDVGKLSRILRIPDLAGEGNLSGKISAEIPLSGQLDIPEATLFDVPIGLLTADFHYADDRVFLHPVRLSKGSSELLIDGFARLEGDIPVELTVHAQPFQIADYVRLLAGADHPIEGVVTGELMLDGTLGQLDGRGTLRIDNGKAWDLALDPLMLPLEIVDYTVNILDFELLTRGQRGVLTAQINTDLDFEVDFQSEPMQLAELVLARGITDFQLDAELVVRANGKGNAREPRVDVSFDFSDVSYAGKPLRDVYISGTYMNNALYFEGMGFDDTCQIRGVLESATDNPYQIFVRGREVDILPILRIFNEALGDYLTGTADGTLEIAGTLADTAAVKLQLSLSTLALDVNGQQLINPSSIELCLADNLWHIQSFALADRRDLRPFLSASGFFAAESNDHQSPPTDEQAASSAFDFVVESDGFALERLAEALGLPPVVSGIARYKLTANGTFDDPKLTLDWKIPLLFVQTPTEPIAVNEAAGSLSYKHQHLTVEQAEFQLFGNPVHIHGCIPIIFNQAQVASTDCQLFVRSDDFQLTALDGLFPQISQLGGRLELQAQVTGDLFQPEVTASIHVNEGTMKLLDFPHPITDVNLDLQVSGGQKSSHELVAVDLKSADWQLRGGRYHGAGNWRLSKTESASTLHSMLSALTSNAPVAFRLQLDAEAVNLVDFANYVMQREIPYDGRSDISLHIQGNGYRPADVSATLLCDDLHIAINERNMRNMNEIRFRFAEEVLWIEPFQIGEASTPWFGTGGSIDVSGNLDLRLTLNRLPFAVLFPALTLPLLNTSIQFDGHLSSQITVNGNLANPVIWAVWQANGNFGDAALQDSGRADYRDRLLVIRDERLIAGADNQLKVFGSIPINLAFQSLNLADRFLDLPIDVRMHGRKVNLNTLSSLLPPLIENSSGTADVDLRILGTTASPYLQGKLSIRDGMLKFIGFDTPISRGKIDLQAEAGEIQIPELRFQLGQGQCEAEIVLRMDGLIPADFEVNRFDVKRLHIADLVGKSFMEEIAADLNGYITATARLHIPVDAFIVPDETAWIPKIIAPFNLPNLIEYATGELDIHNILVESLGYSIRNPKPIEIRLADQGFNFGDGFILEDGKGTLDDKRRLRLTGFGNWEFGKALRFNMRMQNFDLGFISGFVPDAYTVSGFLNASLDVRGTDTAPEIVCAWETSELWINELEVDKFTGEVVYADGQIQIDGAGNSDVRLAIGRNRASLSGLIPFHFSLLDFKAEPLPQDIEGRLDIAIENLDFMPLIIPQFVSTGGTGGLSATIGGQLHALKLKGFADMKDLAFELPDSHIQVDNTRVNLDFTHHGVDIQRIEGQLNGGAYKIYGAIQSNWFDVHRMDVSAELRGDVTFEQPGLYRVTCRKADLAMKGPVTKNGSLKLPPLSGFIRVDEGVYEQHWKKLVKDWFDKAAVVQAEVWLDYPIVRDLQLDLQLAAPDNIWVESDFGKIRIEASINGKIVGPIQKPIFNGRVDLLEGEFSLFAIDHQFHIADNSYIENKNPIEFNPWYEITAETVDPIRNIEVETTDGQRHTKDLKIIARLSGYLNEKHNPELHAEVLRKGAGEEYRLTQRQILAILTVGDMDAFASEASSTSATSDLFLRQSQRYIGDRFAKATGLDETRFYFSPDDLEKSRFLFTKALFERLELTYSSTFQLHGAEPRIEVEYHISPHFAIKGERNEQGKYGIDLKIKQEF